MLMQNKKTCKLNVIIIVLIVLLLIAIGFGIYFLINNFGKEIYKPSSRVDSIKKEKQKDDTRYCKTIGWVKVQGTNIDTPVIYYYGEEFEDYSDSEENYIKKDNYVWNFNGKEKLYNKVNIMGHNILNLSKQPDVGLKYFSRFDDLMAFIYYDFVKDNKYIQYTINNKDYIYKVYSVEFIDYYKLDLFSDKNYSKKEKNKFIKETRKNSMYDFDIPVDDDDKFISLITCTRFFGDTDEINFRINARLVRKNERLNNYRVSKNKNYSKIEKVLGGKKDEKV